MKFILILLLSTTLFHGCASNIEPERYTDDEEATAFEVTPNITLYFTNPPFDTSMDDALIKKINMQSIDAPLDICFYGLNRKNVISAIVNSIKRGVHVRFVGNMDGTNSLLSGPGYSYECYYMIAEALDNAFPVGGKKRIRFPLDSGFNDFNLINNKIMHNKFVLITDHTGKKHLYTGTTNCTDTGFIYNNNNSLIISDNDIVETYRDQFEYLLLSSNKKKVLTIKHHIIDGITIDVLFSPNIIDEKSSMDHIIDLISHADHSIHFMIFSFSHKDLIYQILNKFNIGLHVKGIFDKSQLSNSSDEIFINNGIPCKIDGNNHNKYNRGGKLHHKTMMLDSSQNDAIVITGSFNWSNNSNTYNDENILIIHSKEIAQIYEREWKKRWDEGLDFELFSHGDSAKYQEVIINEVMWMGSCKDFDKKRTRDEFIELKNLTNKRINLNGWKINGAAKGGESLYLNNLYIEPLSFLVIQRYNTSISAFQPDLFALSNNISISNDKIQLILLDPNNEPIDYAGDGSRGYNFGGYNGGGNGNLKKSMARMSIPKNGTDKNNWFTTNTQSNINQDYNYSNYNLATPGEENSAGELEYNPLDIVFSEIAWAGSDHSFYDEWFELYNNSSNNINLKGWIIKCNLNIHLSGVIPAKRHFLFERTDDTSVPDKPADFIYRGSLNNNGAIIYLYYNNIIIDKVVMPDDWAAGSNSPKKSMERIDTEKNGDASNWKDGDGDVEGAQNSSE